jgi:hypothetical protein
MAYKNDHALTIANKWGSASSAAKAELYETYDRLRDLTTSSGYSSSGSGFGTAGNFLWQLATIFAPNQFMSTYGGSSAINIPGTSYWTPFTGSTSSLQGSTSAFGIGGLGSYSGFPSGAASILMGLGSVGTATGGASALASGYAPSYVPAYSTTMLDGTMTGAAVSAAGITGLNAASYVVGGTSGFGIGQNIVMPLAGVVSGFGGVLRSLSPYLGEYGLGSLVLGNLLQGTGSAATAAYRNVTGQVLTNADTILSNKVRNIETVCKMLDTQSDIVRKSLKNSIEGDSKLVDEIS